MSAGFFGGVVLSAPKNASMSDVARSQKKDLVCKYLAEGYTVQMACDSVGIHVKTYEAWRAKDSDFKSKIERVRNFRELGQFDRGDDPGFAVFSKKFLKAQVFPHMLNVVELIEGRQPSWVPAGITYEPGEKDLILVNMPPEHGKSTTITMNYVTYRIATDPNIRVIIVSKTHTMAKKFLFGVKERLTHPDYSDMIATYGPPGGFDKDSSSWSQEMIYVSPDVRTAGEKDPTVQSLGIRGHIYGARADLIILDDCIDHTNAHEYEKQIDWIQGQVLSRLSDSGALLVVGTRLAPRDLYAELRKPDYYPEGESPWTYLSMPAVLSFDDDPEKWATLWPKSNMPPVTGDKTPDEDGLFPKWDGRALARRRARMTPENWARIYQQQQTAEDQIFNPEAVRASINGARRPGIIPAGMPGVRPEGMGGLIVIAGLDPASPSGFVGAICMGLDIKTQKRYIIDVWNKTSMVPDDIRDLIKGWTDKYNIVEWRIEKNAFQTMLTQDREINQFLATRGSMIREHQTLASNKWDVDYGVSSVAMLFAGYEAGNQLIELPSTVNHEMGRTFIEQLVSWMPDAPRNQKTDMVMALWFAELACRDRVMLMTQYGTNHRSNPFATPYDKSQQMVVDFRKLDQWSLA